MSVLSTVAPMSIALLVATIINIIFFVVTSLQKPNEYQQKLTQILLMGSVQVGGYFLRSVSLTSGSFIIAQKMIFLGGLTEWYLIFGFYCLFCKISLPKPAKAALISVISVMCVANMTYDFNGIVYKSYTLVSGENGFLYAEYEAGFFLWVYRVLEIVFTLLILSVALVNMKKSKSKKVKIQSLVFLLVVFIPLAAYIIQLLLSILVYPITLTIATIGLMLSVYTIKIYDLQDTLHIEAFENSKSAIISLGIDNAFRGANPLAMKLFPELENLATSEIVEKENVPILYDVITDEKKDHKISGKIYESNIVEYADRDVKIIWLDDVTSAREHVALLKYYQIELENEVKEKTEHIRQMQDKIMLGMSDIIENRDGSTGGHVKRTSYVVSVLLEAMKEDGYEGVTEEFCEAVKRSAPMHDLGKIAISDAILKKPGKLDDDEFAQMKSHSARGAEMVDQVLEGLEEKEIVEITENIARSHHEKWNGMGYPDNLKEAEIPLEARVMAVADVYDALVSKRCYKPPMSFEQAYGIMDESFGSHFDPSLKKYFDTCLPKIEAYYKES